MHSVLWSKPARQVKNIIKVIEFMKLQLPKEDRKNRVPTPPISHKTNVTIGKTLTGKSESLKVNINTQAGESDSEMVAIYVPLFRTVIPEDLLKFVTLLHKIFRGKDLSTVTQNFGTTQNLVGGESQQVFEQKAQEEET